MDIKIYERPWHTVISICLALGCFIVGMQYFSEGETRLMGIVAFLLGTIFLIVTVYVARTPIVILNEDYIMFRVGNFANKEIPYSTIESWSIQNQDKHFFIHLKKSAQDDNNEIKEILINYRNVKKADRQILTDMLNKKGIYQKRQPHRLNNRRAGQ
jgi:hypothetical protein